jgi:hypothetical protein
MKEFIDFIESYIDFNLKLAFGENIRIFENPIVFINTEEMGDRYSDCYEKLAIRLDKDLCPEACEKIKPLRKFLNKSTFYKKYSTYS